MYVINAQHGMKGFKIVVTSNKLTNSWPGYK
jgi:hypothetical protein